MATRHLNDAIMHTIHTQYIHNVVWLFHQQNKLMNKRFKRERTKFE